MHACNKNMAPLVSLSDGVREILPDCPESFQICIDFRRSTHLDCDEVVFVDDNSIDSLSRPGECVRSGKETERARR